MNKTIFDAAIEDMPLTGKEGFFTYAAQSPDPKEKSFLDTLSSYGKTALKGAVEGISRLGTTMSHTYDVPTIEEGKIKLGRGNKEKQLEEQTEALNELLPTEDTFGQNVLRRGLKEAPTMMSFPGAGASMAARSLIAGGAGETVKELGGPEWLETAAELTSYIGPDLTKKLLSTGKNKEIIDAAKKFGMTDEQITPLLQSEFKQKWLSKLTSRKGKTQKALESTREGLGGAYNYLGETEAAGKEITEKANGKLINSLFQKLEEMPRDLQGKIEKDMEDLLNNKITGKSLFNFYRDINHHLSGNTKQLSLLKEPIKEAIGSLSPELSKDFELVNKMYGKYSTIANRLKPNLVTDLISAGEALGLIGSITMGNYPGLVTIAGEKLGKKIAQQMLINPKLQQLSDKMIIAMNEGKFSVIQKLNKSFSNQLRKSVPEASQILDSLTEEEINNFLKSNHHSENNHHQ